MKIMAIEKAGTSSGGAEIGTSSSFGRFYKVVLGWDYLRLLSDSKVLFSQNFSFSSSFFLNCFNFCLICALQEQNRKQPEGLKAVKNTYANFNEYIRVFEPLLFEEIKAQIVQGRDEEGVYSISYFSDWRNLPCSDRILIFFFLVPNRGDGLAKRWYHIMC